MKKLIATFILASFAVLMLSACGASGGERGYLSQADNGYTDNVKPVSAGTIPGPGRVLNTSGQHTNSNVEINGALYDEYTYVMNSEKDSDSIHMMYKWLLDQSGMTLTMLESSNNGFSHREYAVSLPNNGTAYLIRDGKKLYMYVPSGMTVDDNAWFEDTGGDQSTNNGKFQNDIFVDSTDLDLSLFGQEDSGYNIYDSKPKSTRCDICHGTGTCDFCNGKGYNYNPYVPSDTILCTSCGGNGRCSFCDGKGYR